VTIGATPGFSVLLQSLKRPSTVYWLLTPGMVGFGLAICFTGGTVAVPAPSLQKMSSPVPRNTCWMPVPPIPG
jgi:uncharacterized protein (DUF111 family)